MVRALGRQLRLRHRRRAARAGRDGRRARRTPASAARCAGWSEHQNDDGGWGEDARSYDDPAWVGRGDSARPRRPPGRCSRCTPPARHTRPRRRSRAGSRWLVAHPARRRDLGRAAVHRHRLPVGLLHQLPPLPPHLPGDGARALPVSSRRCPRRARNRRGPRIRERRVMPLLADAPPGVPAPRDGDGAGGRRELPVASRVLPRRSRAHCWRSTASRAWSTNSATRRALAGATAWRPWTGSGGARARLRGRARASAAGAPAADAARLRAAARAVPAADRGQPRRPARQPLRDLGAAARLLRALGQPRRASSCSACSARATPERVALSDRICTALQLAEHWQDVAEDFAARAHLPARRGPRALRLRGARTSAAPGAPHGALRGAAGVRGRAHPRAARRGPAADRDAARPRAARRRRVRRPARAPRWTRSSAPATTCSRCAARSRARLAATARLLRRALLAGARAGERPERDAARRLAYSQCESLTRAAARQLLLRHPPAARAQAARDVRGLRVRAARRRHRRRRRSSRRRSCAASTRSGAALRRAPAARTPIR